MRCRYAECRYADGRYAECRYAECRGTKMMSALAFTSLFLIQKVITINPAILLIYKSTQFLLVGDCNVRRHNIEHNNTLYNDTRCLVLLCCVSHLCK